MTIGPTNPHRERHEEHSHAVVPPHVRAVTHYFHSLTEIWEYYRALGNDPPAEFRAEMKRAEAVMLEILTEETQQGGILHPYYKEQK